MNRSYLGAWLIILACCLAGAEWVSFGGAYARRRVYGAAAIPDSARSGSQFVAVLLPRISSAPGKFSISAGELKDFLGILKADGFVAVGLGDVEDLYDRGRALPRRALLIAFAEDDPQGIGLVDGVLMRLRMRGTAFLTRTASPIDGGQRRFLTRHAVDQMRRGGTWEFGLISSSAQAGAPIPEAGEIRAFLGDGGVGPSRSVFRPLVFTASEMGLNDRSDDPSRLRILALRPGRTPQENAQVVANTLPRTSEFSDDFRGEGLGADWVSGWGIVSRGRGRLALLPTPRQTGVGVYLRGTEKWRDMAVDFELKRFQREFWAYARYKAGGGFIRFGARGNNWYVEQKAGPRNLSNQLARTAILPGDFPARVRLVLKGGSLLAYVNGRMQFGRLLRVNPAIQQGSLFFGTYDQKSRGSQAALTSVRAVPLGEEWIAPKDGAIEFDETRLGELREEAVLARAMSPRWVDVSPDGSVAVVETQGVLLRSLAGFYGCRVVPMAELPKNGAFVLGGAGTAEKTLSGLTAAGQRLDASGLNLHLRGRDVGRPETIAFLKRLREEFRSQRLELWVTLDGAGAFDLALGGAVDGVLRPAGKKTECLEVLDGGDAASRLTAALEPRVRAKTQRLASREPAGLTQREPAFIQ